VVALEQDEMREVRLAIELRKRTSGVGSREHETCKRVLGKLDDAERRRDEPQVLNTVRR
jgi:hypothetical protein